jgi:hypothetical protein
MCLFECLCRHGVCVCSIIQANVTYLFCVSLNRFVFIIWGGGGAWTMCLCFYFFGRSFPLSLPLKGIINVHYFHISLIPPSRPPLFFSLSFFSLFSSQALPPLPPLPPPPLPPRYLIQRQAGTDTEERYC